MKKIIVLIALLSGCAVHTYVPTSEATMSLAKAQGTCKVTAIGATSGDHGLEGGLLLRAAYDGCMEANGFARVAP